VREDSHLEVGTKKKYERGHYGGITAHNRPSKAECRYQDEEIVQDVLFLVPASELARVD
jgi:hypothetical protein